MVFSSVPDYIFDPPPNWHHQQTNHQQQSGIISTDHPLQILPSPAGAGSGSSGTGSIRPGSMLDRARMARVPLPEPGLKCPRCDSSNTKFCYFNNYNLTQPRHFCKACRRYWTRGGALRNVPVGGGCRRNKRSKGRAKSAQPAQRSSNTTITANNNISSSVNTNGNGNGFSSQMLLTLSPQLPFLHHLNGYAGRFGLNLGGGGGGGAPAEFEMGAGSSNINGVSRAQQLSNLLSRSGVTGNGLYPFIHESGATDHDQLDHASGLIGGQIASVKAEENNHGLKYLSKNIMMGIQNDDQYSNWGSGNAWTDISGFNPVGTSGYEDRT